MIVMMALTKHRILVPILPKFQMDISDVKMGRSCQIQRVVMDLMIVVMVLTKNAEFMVQYRVL